MFASNGDVGSLFRIPAKQCGSDGGWVGAEQVSGQPSVSVDGKKSDFNSDNSASWSGAPNSLDCLGFEANNDHVRSKTSLGISMAALQKAAQPNAENPKTTTNPQGPGLNLNQAKTDLVRIDSRNEPISPNNYGQEAKLSLDSILLISISNDKGANWTPMHIIDRGVLSSEETELNIALPDIYAADISNFAVKIEPVLNSSEEISLYIDSVFLDYVAAEAQDLDLNLLSPDGKKIEGSEPLIEANDEVSVELSSKDPNTGVWQGIGSRAGDIITGDDQPDITVKSELIDVAGSVVATEEDKAEYDGKKLNSDDIWKFTANIPVDTRPGKYTLAVTVIDSEGGAQVITQNFYWGVLAINSNRTVYKTDETAYFAITTLDQNGATVCDSDISLEISGPGQSATYKTSDNTITKSDNCEVYSADYTPDYTTSHKLGKEGKYTLKLKAKTGNGEFEITDTIEVKNDQPAYITRTGPTRVYPPVTYPMKLDVTAEQDFKGKIQEVIPSSYEVKSETEFAQGYNNSYIKDSLQYLEWEVDLKAGQTVTLGYDFKVPAISPAFYLLGPAKMISGDTTIFEENRQWQIAGDAVGDIAIYREATGTEAIGTTVSTQAFDTTVSQSGGFSINGGRDAVTLTDGGHYYVAYNLGIQSSGGTNRSEINANIDVAGTNLAYGRASCYIRRTGGVNNCWLSGSAIIDTTAGQTVTIEALRTDSNTATVRRRANESGLMIIKLDDGWDYARISEAGGGQTLNGGFATIDWDTNDELDSAEFSRSGGDITLASTGHYLVTSNVMHRSSSATGTRNNATRLTLDGTEIVGTRTTAYTMGTNSAQDSVSTFTGIIETTSTNQVLRLQGACEGETCNSITNVGGQTAISIVKLPDTADYLRIHEAGGGQIADTAAVVTWDTQSEVDATSFSHNTGANSERIVAEQDGNYLFTTSFYASRAASASTQQIQPHWQFRDTGSTQQWGSNATYNFGNNGTQGAFTSGASSSFLTSLSDNDYVDLNNTDRSTSTDNNVTFQANLYAVQAVRIESLFPSLGPETRQTHYRWRDNSTALNTSGGWMENEDTPAAVSQMFEDEVRLRMEVANVGESIETAARTYELQYGDATNLAGCSSISSWTGVGDSSDVFDMLATTHISSDGQATTPGLLANAEAYTYVNGEGRETADTTAAIGPLARTRYTELEFSMQITSQAVTGHNYCFRLYDTTANAVLDGYDEFPEITMESIDSTIISGLGEAGTFDSEIDGGWSTINFDGSYTTPIVVGTTNSHNGESALVFEARNVTATSAEMRICESQGGSSTGCDPHASETVGYLVVDADKVDDYEGIEAGSFSIGGSVQSTTTNTNYAESFSTTPYVFSSVMSVNGTSPISSRTTTTSTSGFTSGICQQNSIDGCDSVHPSETVGWIAIEPGNVPFTNIHQLDSTTLSNSTWTDETFSTSFSEAPVVVAKAQDLGATNHNVIEEARNITDTDFDIRFCDLDNGDTCSGSHAAEDIAWLAIESGPLSRNGNFAQDAYRIYENEDDVQPVTALAAENTQATNVANRDIIRIRTSVQSGGDTVLADAVSFKLQYAQATTCSAAGSWTDVGAATSSEIWRGYNNATPANGANISSNLLTNSDVSQSYVEQNDSPNNPNAINDGQQAEWDWVIQNNGATANTEYCFRMVTADGDPILYTMYPELTTIAQPTQMYIERADVYTPSVSGAWTDLDLSSYNVPRNRVVEVAIGNINTAAGLNAGVRANGSSIERRMEIMESEGVGATGQGSNYLVMHVQADDDAIIEYYASTAANAVVNILGYWEDGTYVEAFNTITPGVDNTWTDTNLSDAPDNIPANRVIEVLGANGELATENEVGIRRNGSAINRFVDVSEAEAPATAYCTWTAFVQGDASSIIELRGEDVSEMVFYNLGYFDVMPAQFTEQQTNMTNPTASNTWQARDLTASSIPDNAVTEVTLQNGNTANENFMGSRSGAVTLNRQYDVMEAEAGGRIPLRMHTPTDSTASVSLIHQLFTQTPFEYTIYGYWVPNTAPNTASSLSQTQVDDTVIATGGWINETTLEMKASLSDTNTYEALALCIEAQPIAIAFTSVDITCSGQYAYNGTPVAAVATANVADQTEYHWQARVIDVADDYSAYVSYGGNAESARDFGIDTTAPTGGTVYDGPTSATDVEFNDGSLSQLQANWEDVDTDISGLSGYEYSIGTTAGATDILNWTSNGTTADFDQDSLNLNTSQPYYTNIRTTDNAGNTAIISSDGQFVAPTLSFSTTPTTIDIGELNPSNGFSSTGSTTLTTSTNAYNGYLVRGYAEDLLESEDSTINMFDGGSYASPDAWQGADTGYGYHSSDTLVNGIDRFNAPACPGGGGAPPCFAPWSTTAPGDIIADHTSLVSGTPITDQEFIITHRVTTAADQAPGDYTSIIVYSVTARY